MEFQLHVKQSMVKLKITVNIVAGAADTTAPAAPSSLAASNDYHNYKFIMERIFR
jgi:hypothetical protein